MAALFEVYAALGVAVVLTEAVCWRTLGGAVGIGYGSELGVIGGYFAGRIGY